jgi:hypothetical protein
MSESENERESDQLMDWQRFRQVSVLHYLLSIVLYVAREHILYENTFYIIQTSQCATLFTPYSTVCTYSMYLQNTETVCILYTYNKKYGDCMYYCVCTYKIHTTKYIRRLYIQNTYGDCILRILYAHSVLV